MFVEKSIIEEVKVRELKYRDEKKRKYGENYHREGGIVRQIHSGGILTRIIFL